jgi:hypothetical protein
MNAAMLWLASTGLAFLIAASIHLDGPDDIQAAQDVADDHAAMQMAVDKAECRARYGRDAQMYLLDGQHLVCRPADSRAAL